MIDEVREEGRRTESAVYLYLDKKEKKKRVLVEARNRKKEFLKKVC